MPPWPGHPVPRPGPPDSGEQELGHSQAVAPKPRSGSAAGQSSSQRWFHHPPAGCSLRRSGELVLVGSVVRGRPGRPPQRPPLLLQEPGRLTGRTRAFRYRFHGRSVGKRSDTKPTWEGPSPASGGISATLGPVTRVPSPPGSSWVQGDSMPQLVLVITLKKDGGIERRYACGGAANRGGRDFLPDTPRPPGPVSPGAVAGWWGQAIVNLPIRSGRTMFWPNRQVQRRATLSLEK